MTAASAVDIAGSIVNVGVDGTSSPLREVDTVNLIDASAGTLSGTPANTSSDGSGMLGVTLRYEFDILVDGQILLATVTKAAVNEQAKSFSEGRLAGAALLLQGSDLLAESGTRSALDPARGGRNGVGGGYGVEVFSAARVGDVRRNTGSHIDLRGFSSLIGVAKTIEIGSNNLTAGVFFEYGEGSYDAYNSFVGSPPVHADGDTDYRGGGILARVDFADDGTGNLYGEFSFRMGGAHNSYLSRDLWDSSGRAATYDLSSRYHGFHFGLGYVGDITESASVELYGRYLWNGVGDGSVRLSTGEEIGFDRVDSSRFKLGAKISRAFNDHLAAYAGAAFEHEFEGRAGAMTNGFFIPAPNMKGSTGIGELGVSLSPSAGSGLSIDFGAQGYVGKRRGVTGSLSVKFSF
ncbi:MAG: autotransporter outer membrane beta-barrel domain-containing protein [Deltaproteobacteria bacterium]|nr:autotransporter outer membrane beta-barrel domain-containing protein [Deltaproteobacteria bacterium]